MTILRMGLEDFLASLVEVCGTPPAGATGISATVGSAAAMEAPQEEQNRIPSSTDVPQAEQNWAINPPHHHALSADEIDHGSMGE